MEVEHEDPDLEELEANASTPTKWSRDIVTVFRRRMQFIRAAQDERAFYAMKSLHFEKLKGSSSDQRSMRLNSQWRLILRLEQRGSDKVVVIVSIEDYH